MCRLPSKSLLLSNYASPYDSHLKHKFKNENVSIQPKEDSSSSAPSEEEEGLRLLVSQLHNKLRSLEVAHSTDQAQFDQVSEVYAKREG